MFFDASRLISSSVNEDGADSDGDPPRSAELGGAERSASERSGRGGLWDPLTIGGSTVGSGARSSSVLPFSAPTSVLLGGAAFLLGGAAFRIRFTAPICVPHPPCYAHLRPCYAQDCTITRGTRSPRSARAPCEWYQCEWWCFPGFSQVLTGARSWNTLLRIRYLRRTMQ